MADNNPRATYYQRILEALNQRESWENRQRLFYQARYFGVRRKIKPWPTAADLHVQLIDTAIEKLKPSFVNGAIGNDILSISLASSKIWRASSLLFPFFL